MILQKSFEYADLVIWWSLVSHFHSMEHTKKDNAACLKDCVLHEVVSFTEVPQGNVLAPFLFILHTSDFKNSAGSCHLQKCSDDILIVGCVRGSTEDSLVSLWTGVRRTFESAMWKKTKELVLDLKRKRKPFTPVCIRWEDVHMVGSSEFLGTHLNNRVNRSINIQSTCARKGLGHYTYAEQQYIQSMVASDVLCSGLLLKDRQLLRKAGYVLGTNTLKVVTERMVLSKRLNIKDTSITRALSVL